jgi:hypothetical protein
MEEKKLKAVQKESEEKQQKLSYEQLNEACAQLYQQNQNLARQLQQANLSNMFKRLDYLFKVVQYENVFGDRAFVDSCILEIQDALTIREEEENKED